MSDRIIQQIATFVVGATGLLALYLLAGILGLKPTPAFWENLFAALIAGLIVAFVAFQLLAFYIRKITEPVIRLEVPDDFALTRYLDSRLKGDLRLMVRNYGSRPLRSFYWHLFLPKKLNPDITELAPYGKKKTLGTRVVGEYVYAHGYIEDEPLFPKTSFELPIKIWLDTVDARGEWRLKYCLSTEHGLYPKQMEMHRDFDASAIADCDTLTVTSIMVEPPADQPTLPQT